MKTIFGILAVAGWLAAAGLAAAAEGEKPAPKPAIKVTSFTDDMKKLDTQLTFTDEQKAAIQTARTDRDAELTQWDERNERALATAHERLTKAGKTGAQKKAQADVDALLAVRQRIATTYEKKMFDLLTPEQRAKYNGPILSAELQAEFKDEKLTPEQIEKVDALCQDPASKTTEPIVPKKPPATIKVLVGEVINSILTPEQRKLYGDAKNPTKGKTKPTPKKPA
jgi:Spy/CpxP family protein refolding chaperone